jgi:clathrin heavy chain
MQMVALEIEVKERSKKDSQKEQQDADAPIINPGGFGNRLLLTQGNG